MTTVISKKSVGIQDAFDLSVDHEDHQFYLADGKLTSNSHAVSYAIDSFQCATLFYHYPEEWLCSYIETMIGSPETRAKAMSEIRALGYKIKKIDINVTTDEWLVLGDKSFMPSFSTVKALGTAAVEEIMSMRPYVTVEDLLWTTGGQWKHSKFNKRVMENLIKIGAFDSMEIVGDNKIFSSYHHMHEVLCERLAEFRSKKNSKEIFYKIVKETSDIEDWTDEQKLEFSKELLGLIDIDLFVQDDVRAFLNEKKIVPIGEFEGDEELTKEIVWFVVMGLDKKMTKNGKLYFLVKAMCDMGKEIKVFCWDAKGTDLKKFAICVAEVSKSDFGLSTSMKKVRIVENE